MADSLEIHHINVNNGDCTFICIRKEDGTIKDHSTVLIDGGKSGTNSFVYPYLKRVMDLGNGVVPLLEYVILTHYHDDHFNGLKGLSDGTIEANYLIDAGEYDLTKVTPNNGSLASSSKFNPPQKELKYIQMGKSKGVVRGLEYKGYFTAIKSAIQDGHIKKGRVSTTNGSTVNMTKFFRDIGNELVIGEVKNKKSTYEVKLMCIAAVGRTLGKDKKKINTLGGSKSKTNENNFTLGFLLTCGQFRYLTCDDMGGSKKGSYIDQETTLIEGLQSLFDDESYAYLESEGAKTGESKSGHVCAFKINHHGSDHSNNSTFLKEKSSSTAFTSVGDLGSWGLPKEEVLNRMNDDIDPLTKWDQASARGPYNQGVYFTNLLNYAKRKKPERSLDRALDIWVKGNTPQVDFDYGNRKLKNNSIPYNSKTNRPTHYCSYVIKVFGGTNLNFYSKYKVYSYKNEAASPNKKPSSGNPIIKTKNTRTLKHEFCCHQKNKPPIPT